MIGRSFHRTNFSHNDRINPIIVSYDSHRNFFEIMAATLRTEMLISEEASK